MTEQVNAFKIHKQWVECKEGKKDCPFCNNPKKSKWYYDGTSFVVADDAEKPNTLILFPHVHYPQWVLIGSNHQRRVENVIRAIADAIWGRNAKIKIDWEAKTYEHAHVQLTRIKEFKLPEWYDPKECMAFHNNLTGITWVTHPTSKKWIKVD